MLKRIHPLPLLLLGLALLAACGALARRYQVERRNRAVELVIDYNQFRTLTANTGHPLDEALRDARESGVRGAAVTEDVLQNLVSSGRLRVEEVTFRPPDAMTTRVAFREPEQFDRVRLQLQQRLPQLSRRRPERTAREVIFTAPGGRRLVVPYADWTDLLPVPIGLDPLEVETVRRAGLEPVARIFNFLGASPASIDFVLDQLRQHGVRLVVFAGEDVLGYQRRLTETSKTMRADGLLYGSVEFGKQRGDEALGRQMKDRLVRVHSIAGAEIVRMNENDAIDRYVRGATERNIRACYVRLLTTATGEPYADSMAYLRRLSAEMEGAGFTLGLAHPFGEVWGSPTFGRALGALLAAGVGAAALLLLASVVPLGNRQQLFLTLLAAGGGAGMAAIGGEKGRQLLALAAALVFPVLAFVWFRQPVGAFARAEEPKPRPPGAIAVQFLLMCAISLAGAFMVAAILSHRSYMLKIDSFIGIKAAHLLPVLAVAGYYVLGLSNRGSWEQERRRLAERIGGILGEPLRIGHVVAGGVGLVVLALLLLRTGNEPGVGISALEMKFRTLLEDILVRPRTKEFMIGHPALILGLTLAWLPRWNRWAVPFLVVGAIGQASIVNTFCHIHTPVATSLWRVLNGIWLGLLFGLVASVVVRSVHRRWWRAVSQPT